MFEWLQDLVTGAAISYLVIAGFVWLDAWFPIVPGETLVITGGVLAAQDDLSVWLVFGAGFAGAVAGDHFTYLLGDQLGSRAVDKFFRGERAGRRLAWAQRQLRVRTWIIVVARFIPGGRTAVMFGSGMLDVDWRSRFTPYELGGAALWGAYATALGFLFGELFRDDFWLGVAVSLGVAAIVTGMAELLRRAKASPA